MIRSLRLLTCSLSVLTALQNGTVDRITCRRSAGDPRTRVTVARRRP